MTASPAVPEQVAVPGPHGDVPVRVHRGSADRALLWCHGGAYTAGDLDMPEADWVARRLVELTGLTVVTVDYRLATPAGSAARWPARWPVPSDDVLAAWGWLTVGSGSALAGGGALLGGASAGAGLAAGAVLRITGGSTGSPVAPPLPTALFLAYPTLHVVQPAPDPGLVAALEALPDGEKRWGPADVHAMYADLLGPDLVDEPPVAAAPGHAARDDLGSFPRTFVLLSEVDGLRPSGEGFAAALRDAGVDVTTHCEPGVRHGHLNHPEEPAAEASTARVAAWL